MIKNRGVKLGQNIPPPKPKSELDEERRVRALQLQEDKKIRDVILNKLNNSEEEEDFKQIEKGDVIDIKQLLFTKDRDYLIKHNNQRVQAEQLTGKVIVLQFVKLNSYLRLATIPETSCLVDIYNEISPKGCLEVIYIAVTIDNPPATIHEEEQWFEKTYSIVPWSAIPCWDLESRKRLEKRFGGISGFQKRFWPDSFVIDPTGVVLQCLADKYFFEYGVPGFPFSDEKIDFIISEDRAARKHPSMTTLLSSPQRDYVISNSGKKVSVADLEDKVVALYFYEDDYKPDNLKRIQRAYEELANNENFEIVLIYAYDTYTTCGFKTETSFQKEFSTMPWLALPFKDLCCKKLQRIFCHPNDVARKLNFNPTLVIIGPRGNFIECFGAEMLWQYGFAAYPFTRASAAKLMAERAKRVKLDMFWRNPNALFRQTDGPLVTFSQIVGKRIILLVGSVWFNQYVDFVRKLEARYLEAKGTINEFEVIHIACGPPDTLCKEHIAASRRSTCCQISNGSPWLMHPKFPLKSHECYLLHHILQYGYGLLAFDNNGRLVKRIESTSLINKWATEFSFHGSSLENDVLYEVLKTYQSGDFLPDREEDSPSKNQ